jgi:LysR family transcriptional regulator, cys regulon transcriptional activator
MNLQQMRCVVELVRQNLKVSATARALNTSQPAVTKQLRQLENELGTALFVREQHRLGALTAVGGQVVKLAQDVCLAISTIKRIGAEANELGKGEIRIAVTHAQAKFILPPLMQAFRARYPNVKFELVRSSPAQIVAAVGAGEVDLGVTPEIDAAAQELRYITYATYPRLVLFPKKHALARKKRISFKMLAAYPIITTAGSVGGTEVFDAFAAAGVKPNVQLSAPDFDVVKVCLERGLGIALLPSYTFDPQRDRQLRALDASTLLPPSVTRIVIHRNRHLPKLVQDFLELVVPGKSSRASH